MTWKVVTWEWEISYRNRSGHFLDFLSTDRHKSHQSSNKTNHNLEKQCRPIHKNVIHFSGVFYRVKYFFIFCGPPKHFLRNIFQYPRPQSHAIIKRSCPHFFLSRYSKFVVWLHRFLFIIAVWICTYKVFYFIVEELLICRRKVWSFNSRMSLCPPWAVF